jgi:hypothetical protein
MTQTMNFEQTIKLLQDGEWVVENNCNNNNSRFHMEDGYLVYDNGERVESIMPNNNYRTVASPEQELIEAIEYIAVLKIRDDKGFISLPKMYWSEILEKARIFKKSRFGK